jgi:hypothetical protein
MGIGTLIHVWWVGGSSATVRCMSDGRSVARGPHLTEPWRATPPPTSADNGHSGGVTHFPNIKARKAFM